MTLNKHKPTMQNITKHYLHCPHTSNYNFKALATVVHGRAETYINKLAGKGIKTGSVVGLLNVYCFTEVSWDGVDVKTQTHSSCTHFNLHIK
jgi:hypothetical protein